MWNISDRVAIVTGAANGIGRAVAELFASEGAVVVMADVEKEPVERAAAAIRQRGGKVRALICDVGDSSAVQALVRTTEEEFGRIDILVANAAVQITKSAAETEEEEWDRIHRVNLKGVFLCSKYVVPVMQRQNSGAIVISCSGHAFVTFPNCSAYAASKGGEMAFMRGLALDCAPYGIRVNCIIPGATDTRLLRGHMESTPDPAKSLQDLLNTIPLRRLATPDDVARGVLFLVSDHASYITGTSLAVDGGFLAQG